MTAGMAKNTASKLIYRYEHTHSKQVSTVPAWFCPLYVLAEHLLQAVVLS